MLQNKDRGYTAIWNHILKVSIEDLQKNYSKLDVHFDLWKKESDAQPYIPDMVQMLKDKGLAYISNGALVVDVAKPEDTKEVPPCIILKSDGASLYQTTDLATIVEGRITVNGKKAESGQKVSLEDEICADNIPVHKNEKKVLLLFNKPRGIVCSTKQQFDETTVTDYLDYPLRVYPVGRLDKESQGLLLLTNEGDLVNKIMRAGNYHEKEYFVTVNKPVDREFVRRMSKGVPVLDTVTRPCRVVQTGECSFRIILTQGLNRQIRRMCRYLGYEVQKLKRIRIMNLTLDGIREGEYREITAQEWEELNHLLESSTSETVIRTGEQNGNSSDHANERAGAKAGQGSKGVLPAGYRDHKQQRVRSDVRRASGSGERDRHCSGKQPNRKRRVRGS